MQNFVFVLDAEKKPLSPCHPSVARKLLTNRMAAIFRRFPFTIILKRVVENIIAEPLTVKIDPGSKTTGMVLVQGDRVIFASEITHRGQAIKDALESRRSLRRGRRQRNTRYRCCKSRRNRNATSSRPKGWLSPSIKSRVDNILTWVKRHRRFAPVGDAVMELVKFDMQLMANPEIDGIEYQQGKLQGYNVREYLLDKFERKCAYCGVKNVRLEVEHINPRSRGGTNSVANLCIACHTCNQAKGNRTAIEFGYPEVQASANATYKDAAAVNTSRCNLYERLREIGLPVKTGSGAMTKYNRSQRGYPKAHWIDAANVLTVADLDVNLKPLLIKATGHGTRQMCQTNKYGNAICHRSNVRSWKGWKTGDMAKAIIPRGKYAGVYLAGRVTAKQQDQFKFTAHSVGSIGVNCKHLTRIHRKDGYEYRNTNTCS